MLDGELVIRDADGNLEFDALQSRIHPAESRINLLAKEIPADYIVFDLLAEGDESLLERAAARAPRAARGAGRAGRPGADAADPRPGQAEEWLRRTEGTMAKQLDAPYVPGKRKGMAKVKREREIDCVVLGWRPGQRGGHGGLADPRPLRRRRAAPGRPHLRLQRRGETGMPAMLAPLETGESGTAEPSRWTGGRDLEWVALRPELVIEVGYDHAAAGRIRHGARFRRFRDDKDPRECLF